MSEDYRISARIKAGRIAEGLIGSLLLVHLPNAQQGYSPD